VSVLVDAHLDLAWNALFNGRDLRDTVVEIRRREPADLPGVAMTSLPSLSAADVGIVFATLYATPSQSWLDLPEPRMMRHPTPYDTHEEAERAALEMLEVYEQWEREGQVRIIRDASSLRDHLDRFLNDRVLGLLVLMEGADPIRDPDDLSRWFERGVRIVGLAWQTTRYAGGTGSSEALTAMGRELIHGMAEMGIVHDAAHLSEEAFWEAVGLPHHALCVTHASVRSLMQSPGVRPTIPLNRFLSDGQIVEACRPRGASSRGVVGLALLNDFLEPHWRFGAGPDQPDVTVAEQVSAHLNHIANLVGWKSVAIGSDVDTAHGRDETPLGLDSVADWREVAAVAPATERDGLLGLNWLRFLDEVLR
jgi:membrane dipeptidase